MIRIPERRLASDLEGVLGEHQARVNAVPDYAERVTAAQRAWENKSRERFRPIRAALTEMCSGEDRCMYCEDSGADEIEHVRPKSLYPEQTFVWENYLYACGRCNGPKSNSFSVVASKRREVFTIERKHGEPVAPPEPGSMLLIDPRREDPLRFLRLELASPFHFHAIASRGCLARAGAAYTIQVLCLNGRDTLLLRRGHAYGSYVARLKQYVSEVDPGQRGRMAAALQRQDHPTVWREMQRQHRTIDDLRALFEQAPEALTWRGDVPASSPLPPT